MRQLVLDASAALQVVLRRRGSDALVDLLTDASTVAAPRVYLSEAANALWKYVRAGHLEEVEALERLAEMSALVDHPIEEADLVSEALSAAVRYGHPVYDAMYAVLARRLSCPVATRDRRLGELLARMRVDSI